MEPLPRVIHDKWRCLDASEWFLIVAALHDGASAMEARLAADLVAWEETDDDPIGRLKTRVADIEEMNALASRIEAEAW